MDEKVKHRHSLDSIAEHLGKLEQDAFGSRGNLRTRIEMFRGSIYDLLSTIENKRSDRQRLELVTEMGVSLLILASLALVHLSLENSRSYLDLALLFAISGLLAQILYLHLKKNTELASPEDEQQYEQFINEVCEYRLDQAEKRLAEREPKELDFQGENYHLEDTEIDPLRNAWSDFESN